MHSESTRAQPLIVSLKFDEASFGALDDLRRQHFPRERNFLSAHLTLFHALPGAEGAAISARLADVCAATPIMRLGFPRPLSLGRGVAIAVHCPELIALRAQLAHEWRAWLTPQDRQGLRPHVTIQNKVAPEAARALLAQLADEWVPFEGRGEGLVLWRYLGGPWGEVSSAKFR